MLFRSLTGQKGPDGSGDIDDIDEGTSSLIRQLWNANELPTDEAECIWGDAGIPEFNHASWGDSHPMMKALYYRLYMGITYANNYLESTANSTDPEISTKRAEARFLRALHYSYLMDLFGNVPLVLNVSKESAPQVSRKYLFDFINGELREVCGETAGAQEVLSDAKVVNGKQDGYGRANKAAAWLLLARDYINAKVYSGTEHNDSAKYFAQKVIDTPYNLCKTPTGSYSGFQKLFMADNDVNGAENEIILPAIHDGWDTQTWGGCLFLIASTTDADIIKNYPTGTSEQWGGNHARKQFVQKFFPSSQPMEGTPTEVAAQAGDNRALFYTKGFKMSITKETDFKSGYVIAMLPQPFVTSALAQVESLRVALDMNEEWEKVAGSKLVTGVLVARKDAVEADPARFAAFMDGYKASVEAANTDLENTAALCEQYGIVAKAALAQKALPNCNIVFETGDEMKTDLETYFNVLYAADPISVGGQLPADDFYYAG